MTPQPPAPPYLGPPRFHGGHQPLLPCKRVVIHCTVSPCVAGGARSIARYFRETVTTPSSAHYCCDPGETVQITYDHVEAYHAPPNFDTLGIELCDPQTPERPARVKGVLRRAPRWWDNDHTAMLVRAADLTAALCLAYDVPVRRVRWPALKLGRRGICGHVTVSRAFHQTSHTDPGVGFPWRRFMRMVRKAAAVQRAAAKG